MIPLFLNAKKWIITRSKNKLKDEEYPKSLWNALLDLELKKYWEKEKQ